MAAFSRPAILAHGNLTRINTTVNNADNWLTDLTKADIQILCDGFLQRTSEQLISKVLRSFEHRLSLAIKRTTRDQSATSCDRFTCPNCTVVAFGVASSVAPTAEYAALMMAAVIVLASPPAMPWQCTRVRVFSKSTQRCCFTHFAIHRFWVEFVENGLNYPEQVHHPCHSQACR